MKNGVLKIEKSLQWNFKNQIFGMIFFLDLLLRSSWYTPFFCRGCFHGGILNTKSPDFRFFKQLKKRGGLCGQINPFGCVHGFFLGAYLVEFFVGFVAVYSIFSGGALFMEIFAKQNRLFHNFWAKKSFSWLIRILSKL